MTLIRSNTPAMRGYYAGFVSRAIAFIIDLLLVVIVQFLFIVIARLIFNFLGIDSIFRLLDNWFTPGSNGISNPFRMVVTWVATFLGGMVFFGIYVAVAWTLIDKTIGQALLGLRVLRSNGDHLTFRKAIRRAVCLIVAALPLFLGFLWVLVDDRRQGWHDKLADTVVVYDWEARLGSRLKEWLARQQDQHLAPSTERVESPPAGARPAVDSEPTPDGLATPSQKG